MAKSIKSPSAVVAFLVTQETFDSVFNAGRALAAGYATAGEALQSVLAPLSGLSTESAVAQWNEYRRAFALGMAAERNIDPDSGRRAFNRITEDMGLTKPQTEAAKAKQAARAKKAPAAEGDESSTPKDGAGTEAAAQVKMVLSGMEAHLIAMLRAGKFEMVAQAVADLATAAG